MALSQENRAKLKSRLASVWAKICLLPTGGLALLDWTVKVIERLLVIGVALLAFFFGYHFYHASLSSQQKDVIGFVSQNWKIVLILMIPLFYQTVRTFLEEVQEAWGIKRTPKQALNLNSVSGTLSEVSASAASAVPTEEEL